MQAWGKVTYLCVDTYIRCSEGVRPLVSVAVKLIERTEQLGRLRARADGARAGRGAMLIVSGESGAGKTAFIESFVDDWVRGADHGEAWVPKVYSTKWRAVEAAKRVVDVALDVAGGAAMFGGNELERLYRDVRAGGFHPGNDALTHELVGKAVLGILPEQPRW